MEHPSCLPYYYPTTVVLVDDNVSHLDGLRMVLDAHVRCFDSPRQALQEVNWDAPTQPRDAAHLIDHTGEAGHAALERVIGVDLSAFHLTLYDPHRFDTVSVVVVDYDMPSMDGLAFCRALAGSPVKKIMLTGVADKQTGVDAMNDNIIHCFLEKQRDDKEEALRQYVHKLQREYFQERAALVSEALTVETPLFLHDPAFVDWFDQYRCRHGIEEHYLLANPSGLLLVNAAGQLRRLVVQTREELDDQVEFLRTEGAPEALIQPLRHGRVVACFRTDDGYYRRGYPHWREDIHPAQIISGRERFFVAEVEGPAAQELGGGVLTYDDYLRGVTLRLREERGGYTVSERAEGFWVGEKPASAIG